MGHHNFARMLEVAIDHQAVKCLEVLINTYHSSFEELNFDFSDPFIKKLLRREEDSISASILELLFAELSPQSFNSDLVAAFCTRTKAQEDQVDTFFARALETYKDSSQV